MSDFPVKEKDNVNNFGVLLIGLATTAVLWASVVALQANFEDTSGDMADKRAAIGLEDEARDLLAKERLDLETTKYADPNKGTLKRLSIENAKRAVVRDAKANASTLIPTLGTLNVPTVPATAGKPVLVPPAAPDVVPAPEGGEVLPGTETAVPSEEAATATEPGAAEAAPSAPATPATGTGTNP